MTCVNRMGQAAEHVSSFALGVCGALLIATAVQGVPTFGHSQPAAVITVASTTH